MKVYAKPDEQGKIIFLALECELDEKEINTYGWVVVGHVDNDDHYAQADVMAGTWLGKPLCDDAGHWRYKLVDGKAVERTAEEIAGDPEIVEEATQLDRIEAQVAFTAMMTDTLLEV